MGPGDLQTAPWETEDRFEPIDSGEELPQLESIALAEGIAPTASLQQVPAAEESTVGLMADSFAMGVAFMFALNVIQRVVGLVRNVLVCRLLEPEELGRWNLAFSFLLLAAPLAVLGLPGVCGRYVEYYRHRGQLRSFLRRILFATMAVACVAIAVISLAPGAIAQLVFNDSSQAPLIRTAVAVLALVITFNFLTELLTALRQVRLVAIMQFSHSFMFACGAIGMLWLTSWGTEAVITAYALGCLVATLLAAPMLWTVWRTLPTESQPSSAPSMWRKLLPFATWILATNILASMYHVADRYMLVHFAAIDAADAAALVGQYHSSCVAPDLFLAVATMLAGVLLPYLANAWEGGERASVWRQLTLTLKLVALSFTAGGVALLIVAPVLFDWVLGGKYEAGLAVLAPTMLYCIWTGLLSLSTTYLWCRERPVLGSAALLAGVIVNLIMNFLLVPSYGLMGAVVATAIANASALSLTYCFNAHLQMPIPRSLWLASGVPLLLLSGPILAPVFLLAVLLIAWRTPLLFTAEEKQSMQEAAHPLMARFA